MKTREMTGTAKKRIHIAGGFLLLVVALVLLFFWNTDYIQGLAAGMGAANPLVFVALFVGVNAVFETAVGAMVSGALARALYPVVCGSSSASGKPAKA